MTESLSLALVDPQLRRLLESFPPLLLSLEELPRIRAEGAEFRKQLNAAAAAAADTSGPAVQCEQRLVPGRPARRRCAC